MTGLGVDTYRFSVRLAADPARRHRARPTPRGSRSTTGWSTPSSRRGSRRARRCSTGTPRRPCRTRAAGSSRDIADRFADYAAILVDTVSATASTCGPRINEPRRRHDARPRRSARTPPGARCCSARLPVAHHQLLAHGRAVQALRAPAAHGRSGSPATTRRRGRRRTADEDVEAATLLRHPGQLALRRPGPARALPARLRRAHARPGRRRPRGDPRAARLVRAQPLLPDPGRRPGRRRGRCRSRWASRRATPTTDFGWPVVPDAFEELLVVAAGALRRRAAAGLHHGERLLVRRRPRGRRTGARRPPGRVPRRLPARPAARPASAASTSVATSSGRCWTTSSGPRATPSASVSCTSTSTPRPAPRRTPSTGTAT